MKRSKVMETVFEGLLALSYFCAGTACTGIVLTKLREEKAVLRNPAAHPAQPTPGEAPADEPAV